MARTFKFLHPGSEWKPIIQERENEGIAFWTLRGAGHTRRFIRASGYFLREAHGPIHQGEIGFWGEYEAPTRFKRVAPAGRRPPHEARLPTFIHEPLPDVLRPFGALNTDPIVLGPVWIYSNCQQRTGIALQDLDPGDVLFFGSKMGGVFVLDTVFVIADRPVRYTAGCTRMAVGKQVPEHIHELALDLVDPGDYSLYKGATYASPINDMFSFVPCLPLAEAPQGFARPAAPLSLQNNLGRKFQYKGLEDAFVTWTDTVRAVLESGLCLGVSMQLPELDTR